MKNKKSLGQNWLKDRTLLLEIARLASPRVTFFDYREPKKTLPEAGFLGAERRIEKSNSGACKPYLSDNTVLEIGPGLGTLTSALLKVFKKVIAIELDPNLAKNLPKSFPGKNLKIINENILDFNLDQLPKNYAVAGNIPYNITSPIIQKLLQAKNKPQKITLLVQKEVAERLAAKQGKYSILGLSAQIYAEVSLGPIIKRDLFTPVPKVDSQLIILKPRKTPLATEKTIALIKLGFSAPRKKLSTNLSATLRKPRQKILEIFNQLNIPEQSRPADLSIDSWVKLQKLLTKNC